MMLEITLTIDGGYRLTLTDYDSKIRIEGQSGAMEMELGSLKRAVDLLFEQSSMTAKPNLLKVGQAHENA